MKSTRSIITTEVWTCSVAQGEDAHAMCKELKAARWLLVPVLILGAMLLVAVLRLRFLKGENNPRDEETVMGTETGTDCNETKL